MPTLEDYGLERAVTKFSGDNPLLDFLQSVLDTDAADWKTYRIINPSTRKTLSECVVSVEKQVVVIFIAYLVDESSKPPVRHTSMRLWEMIVDIWTHARGAPQNLKYVAVDTITNKSARAAIHEDLRARGYGPSHPDSEVYVDVSRATSSSWDRNVFARMGDRVASALSGAGADQVAARLLRERDEDWPNEEQDVLFMIIELFA